MKSVIQWNRVSKRFGRQVALDDVSIDVSAGVVFALLGENGAGKTTAIRILLGLETPDSGQTHVLGIDSGIDGRQIRQRVGYVPERPTLYEWMTVSEIGWFAAGFYPSGYLDRYLALARHFELPADRKIKHLSKGMRSKVSLSIALAHEPPVLFLDEPTSGLDALVRREFLESMVDVAAEGRTVLLASHQIAEVECVADVVAILRHGKIVLIERLETLKETVREVTITMRNGSLELPAFSGTVVSREHHERQWRLLVSGVPDDQILALRRHEQISDVQSRTPSLEEIFCGYMRSRSAADSSAAGGSP